ncbi:hypothetical protein PT974_12327 [Cladobotryum mycophilum]|uniref:Uncharacterized protein n=1 Tax=Cladobotryum mycophilum TaxID=491253 RepID=A0ABR0S8M4_9HYPO
MAVAVGEYSVSHFQSLPSLEAVRANFSNLDGDELVKNVFKDFFVEHGMDRKFGLTMIHRHFDLAPGEKLVDYDGTSVPWQGPDRGLSAPQPCIWAFSANGELKPTEFRYSEAGNFTMGEDELLFIQKFKALLESYGATEVFGLCLYPGDDFNGLCEITVGRANINLKPADWPKTLKAVDTAWFFSEPVWKRGCRCFCDDYASDHSHNRHVLTV